MSAISINLKFETLLNELRAVVAPGFEPIETGEIHSQNNAADRIEFAKGLAKELAVESLVRTVALNGRSDEAKINFSNEWGGCHFQATQGAGTNSTKLYMQDGEILYMAHDYGKHVEVFRRGPWVERLRLHVEYLKEQNRQRDAERRQAEQAAMLDSFSDIAF